MEVAVDLGVHNFSRLFLNRFNHFGMAMPGIRHANTAGKIKIPVTLRCVNMTPFAALDYQVGHSAPNRGDMG
jgi:hypothetical protein